MDIVIKKENIYMLQFRSCRSIYIEDELYYSSSMDMLRHVYTVKSSFEKHEVLGVFAYKKDAIIHLGSVLTSHQFLKNEHVIKADLLLLKRIKEEAVRLLGNKY